MIRRTTRPTRNTTTLLFLAATIAANAAVEDAWKALPSYEVGQDRTCVLQLKAYIARTADAISKEKIANAARLAALLPRPETTDDARLFICQQLARIGNDPEVPAVAALLKKADRRSTQMACAALIGINTETARAALRTALRTATEETAPDLIQAVAAVRDPRAVEALGKRLNTATTADAALFALGEIGTEPAAQVLLKLKPSSSVLDALIRCAERLARIPLARKTAQTIYDSVATNAETVHHRTAALLGLVTTEAPVAACRVGSALGSENSRLARTAVLLLPAAFASMKDEEVVANLETLPPATRAFAISAMAERGRHGILPLVLESLKAELPELRLAAIRALGRLGNADHVKTLTDMATSDDSSVATSARESLTALPGYNVDAAIGRGLAEWDGAARTVLVEVAVRRQIPNLSPTLLAIADKTPALRGAVYAALAEIGTSDMCPALLERLSAEMDDATRKALEAAIAKLAEDGTPALAEAWKDTRARASILRILARRGGSAGLELVRDTLEGGDAELRREAIRALSGWSDAAAVDELLKLAKAKDDKFASTMAVRGLMAQVDRTADLQSRLAIVDTLAALPDNPAANDWAEKKRAALFRKKPRGTVLKHVPERSAARKQELAKKAPKGYRVVAYLDCGPDVSDGGKGKPTLRVRSGAPFLWSGAERHADVRAASVVYAGASLRIEASGLDSKKSYKLGLTWWDYDHNARVQTVALGGRQVLKATKLPSYRSKKAPPATIAIDVPASAYASGTMPIDIGLAGGVNTVLSEIWLYESGEAPKVTEIALPKPRDPKAKRILLITGEDFKGHKWQETAPALRDELEEDPRLAVDVVEDLTSLKTLKLDDYAAVVMHFKNYDPEVPGRAGYDNLAAFVEKGGGLVLVHFACGAFQEFRGDFVKLGGRAWNPKMRGHDPFGTFAVDIVKPDHPAVAGLEDFQTTDELYTCLDGDTPIEVLATAISKVDKKTYPMVFVLNYGKGRVYHCVLGHNVAALINEPVAELFRRGTAWVAGLEAVAGK